MPSALEVAICYVSARTRYLDLQFYFKMTTIAFIVFIMFGTFFSRCLCCLGKNISLFFLSIVLKYLLIADNFFSCIKARPAITNCEQYISYFFYQTCNKLVTCYELSICKLVTKVKTYYIHTIFILGHFFSRNHLFITDIIFLKLPFTYCFSILITVRIQFNYVRYKKNFRKICNLKKK